MGEYFELALYDSDKDHSEANLNILRDYFDLPQYHNPPAKRKDRLMSDREMCVYSVEYRDFAVEMLCYDCLAFTKDSFKEELQLLTQTADTCFKLLPTVNLITGIYELTGYLIKDNSLLSETDKSTLSGFPFIFRRADSIPANMKYDCRSGNTVCIFNLCAQDVF